MELDQMYLDSLKEGKFDKDMLSDPAMVIVDQDIESGWEAEEELLNGESLADSEMIDLIAGDNELEDMMEDLPED
nr:MAG TPA: hypothetical protein [Caudoviricetes sp.]